MSLRNTTRICSIEECEKRATGGRGWCPMHWSRWRKHGDPSISAHPYARTLADRLWPRLVPDGECLIWTGAANKEGYGRIWLGEALGYAHRVAYELTHGPIPAAFEVDHLCRRPACCHPDHLEAVTKSENVIRGNRDAARERRTLL